MSAVSSPQRPPTGWKGGGAEATVGRRWEGGGVVGEDG